MNEFETKVFEVLNKKYPEPEWIVLPQVRTFTGCATLPGGERYIDFFIINTYPSKDFKCIAIEAKKSIEDYRSDVKNFKKQATARFYSDAFYYLMPEDLYVKHEIEILADWKNCHETGIMLLKESSISVVRRHHNSKSPFSMGFICSLLRQALKY